MSVIMKGITCCADCAYYNMKKHKCTRATDEGKPTDHFYADCPLPTVTKAQGWVSVKDRLPEKEGHYLCWACINNIQYLYQICLWKENSWYWVHDVRWWMPLPEPPKEGDGE